MKNLKFISAILVLFAAFSVTSCSDVEPLDPAIELPGPNNPDPNNPNNPNPNAPASFKVDFDGQTYTATTVQAIVNDDYIAITAIRGSNVELFQITIPEATEGTYTFSTTSMMALAYSKNDGNSAFVATPQDGDFSTFPEYVDNATVTITDINTTTGKISGTFRFTGARFVTGSTTAIETKAFTNGAFTNLPFTPDVTAPTGNTFTAKLDGAAFTPTNISATVMANKISIIGRRGTIENISLNLPETIATGTYDLDFMGDYVGLYIMNATSEGSLGAESGSVTITSHNTSTNRIKGTFHFVASSLLGTGTPHEITEGTFDVGY